MKKLVLTLGLVGLIATGCNSTNKASVTERTPASLIRQSQTIQGPTDYKSDEWAFQISLPKDWILEEVRATAQDAKVNNLNNWKIGDLIQINISDKDYFVALNINGGMDLNIDKKYRYLNQTIDGQNIVVTQDPAPLNGKLEEYFSLKSKDKTYDFRVSSSSTTSTQALYKVLDTLKFY